MVEFRSLYGGNPSESWFSWSKKENLAISAVSVTRNVFFDIPVSCLFFIFPLEKKNCLWGDRVHAVQRKVHKRK